ncbi:MAG TPA: GDSL-type esterase/lipase family protein [Thermoanaerobaculia bacterium]|nr:GDSL-type esterase/lipase family protein [Thermoanaerobaculia bacterium]
MRRIIYWFLPLTAALAAAVAFGAGFYSFLRGDTGRPVNPVRPAAAVAAEPREVVSAIVLGDSLGRGAGDPTGLGIGGRLDAELRRRNLAARRTVNVAVSGARTGDLLRQLESANMRRLIGEANVVIVSIGGNDLWGGSDWRNAPPPDPAAVMDEVLDRIERVMSIVRRSNPTARIFVVGLYNPFRDAPFGGQLTSLVSRWNGRLIERFSADPDLTVIQTADLFSHRDRLALDRFHPSGEGYELIARRIADAL